MMPDLIQKNTVFHVGSMEYSKKSNYSLEGDTLSVSTTPKTWSKLARTNGQNNKLYRKDSLFVDYYKILEKKKNEIINFGLSFNYLIERDVYLYHYYDDEMDLDLTFQTLEKNELLEEYPDIEDDDISIQKKFVLSAYGKEIFPHFKSNPVDITPIVIEYVRNVVLKENDNIVGIWWNDHFDPLRFSAPRGAIFNEKLHEFDICKVSELTDYIDSEYEESFSPKL
jgi:hypothetical protein